MGCSLRGDSVENAMVSWEGTVDDDGYREYKLVLRVEANVGDGPSNVLRTFGLPIPGVPWVVREDKDFWVWFYPTRTVKPYAHKPGEKTRFWDVECKATNKPNKLCKDQKIEDPLFEPMKVSGGTHRYTEEARLDRFNFPLLYSSLEQIHGPAVEFDRGRDVVRIEQNVPFLELRLCTTMRDTVNAFPLWGLPKRCIKLSSFEWERKYWGRCYSYYTRRFEFEANVKIHPITGAAVSAWDRDILDEGHMVLAGKWKTDVPGGRWVLDNIGGALPNRFNPMHFVSLQDRNGNLRKVFLNGAGLPAGQIVAVKDKLVDFLAIKPIAPGVPLADGTSWIALVSNELIDFIVGVSYPRGTLVFYQESVYVSLGGGLAGALPGESPLSWLLLPTGTHDQGNWNILLSYVIGDVVVNAGERVGQGVIHVEAYGESDFLRLGIPIIL